MLVQMLVTTGFDGKTRNQGSTTDVPPEVAQRWITRGLALPVEEEEDVPPMLLSIEDIEALPPEQLRNYASVHKVDIGRATTEKGIIDKILEAGKVFQKPVED